MNYSPRTIKNILKLNEINAGINAIALSAVYGENLDSLYLRIRSSMPDIVDACSELSDDLEFPVGNIHDYFIDFDHTKTKGFLMNYGFVQTTVHYLRIQNELLARLSRLMIQDSDGHRLGQVMRSLLSNLHDLTFIANTDDIETIREGSRTVIGELLPF